MLKWIGRAVAVLLILLVVGFLALMRSDIPAAELEAKYTNAESEFVELPSGARLHFRDQGNPDGPPLLLVHGSGSSLHTWEPWVAALGDSFRVISLDLPAHGLTGPVPGEDYTIRGYGRAVDQLMAHLGLDRFALAGNSMGGNTAWVYALDHPEKLTALVLIGSSGLPEAAGEEDPLIFELMSTSLGRALLPRLGPGPMVEDAVRASFVDQSKVTPEMIDRYVELLLREGNRAASAVRFTQPRPLHLADRLGELAMPVLIMHGDGDNLVPVDHAHRFAKTIPGAELIIYEGVGHIPMEEIPLRSAADLRVFLSTNGAAQ